MICEGLLNPQSSLGLGCGFAPSNHRCCKGAQSAAQFYCKISDPQKTGNGSLSTSPLSSSLPFRPVAALSSSLKFFRFGREEDSWKSSQIGFQENGDVERVSLVGVCSSDDEVVRFMDDSQGLKSVDIKNLISLAVEGVSGGGADARLGMIRSAEHMSRPLVHNFARLSSFWKKENVNREASPRSESETSAGIIESCQFIPPSCGCRSGGTCCSESGSNAATVQVTPHSEIARNKEYFARFLYRVPSAERERITQMAYLSNLAYRIPTIEVRFSFVTPCCTAPSMWSLERTWSQLRIPHVPY